MIDILKRIFIGVAIGMSIFFLKTEVFALSWDLEYVNQSYIFNTGTKSFSFNLPTGSATSRDMVFDTSFTAPSGAKFAVFNYGADWLHYNNLYFTHTSNDNNSDFYAPFYFPYLFKPRVLLASTNYGWSNCELQDSFIVCPILPGGTYNKLVLQITYSDSSYDSFSLDFLLGNTVQYYTSNVYSAIQSQTDDLQNSDAPASATYNNDYSTSSYDTAEQSINSNVNVDVSSFIFNPSQWAQAFSWIWSTLTSFVQVNGKVFATITSFLTFSFVGLVIGRS